MCCINSNSIFYDEKFKLVFGIKIKIIYIFLREKKKKWKTEK